MYQILELKVSMDEMKNVLESIGTKAEEMEERISNLEHGGFRNNSFKERTKIFFLN